MKHWSRRFFLRTVGAGVPALKFMVDGQKLEAASAASSGVGSAPSSPGGEGPFWGLPAPDSDFRRMVRRHVIRKAVHDLNVAGARRAKAASEKQVPAYARHIRKQVSGILGELPFGSRGGPLHVRPVSEYRRKGYRLENLIFESFPGWEVNATVYLPSPEISRPPWIPVIMPVGHCSKTNISVQYPAQVFARCGYLVITFDPPMFGEKAVPGDNHFTDGVRCYLNGMTSQRYFIEDAFRAIDYVATRPDVDMSHGVGMTGVSGGGLTTLYCAPLDDRIKASAPSCCASPDIYNPVRNTYATCPENLAMGRYAKHLDTIDLVLAAYPKPLLLMGGKLDTLYKPEWNRMVADEVEKAYAAGGLGDRFRLFLDECPHAYTVAQALQAVRWMDRWVRGVPGRELPKITEQDVELVPDEMMKCHPSPSQATIFSINRQDAERLAKNRADHGLRAAAIKLIGSEEAKLPEIKPQRVQSAQPFLELDRHYLQEMLLTRDEDTQLPATILYNGDAKTKLGAILYFDDRGRWADLGSGGLLTSLGNLSDNSGPRPAVLTADLRGWGDTEPAYGPYEVWNWGSPQRWLGYMSAAIGDPVLAMRIRDGLAALAYLRSRPEVDPQRVVVGGHGMGGVVAMHVAVIDGHIRAAFANEILGSFQMLADSLEYAWEPDAFFPNVLRSYDLPELIADLEVPVLVVNPLDAMKQPLAQTAANQLYSKAAARRTFELETELATSRAHAAQVKWANKLWQS
jgi:dienelactone hydrolase